MSYYKNILRVPNSIKGQLVGSKIICYEVVDSTNEILKKLINEDPPNGTVVLADSQTQGKGRFGRAWHSEKKSGLYCSILFYYPFNFNNLPIFTLMAGVAVVKTINQFSNKPGTLKWPNDVLINNKKVSGILTENISRLNQKAVIVGIGVNLNHSQFPSPIDQTATSLLIENGNQVQVLDFIQALLRQIELYYKNFKETGAKSILETWKANTDVFGRKVILSQGQKKIKGIAQNIDEQGNLIIISDSGETLHFGSGEVSLNN